MNANKEKKKGERGREARLGRRHTSLIVHSQIDISESTATDLLAKSIYGTNSKVHFSQFRRIDVSGVCSRCSNSRFLCKQEKNCFVENIQ